MNLNIPDKFHKLLVLLGLLLIGYSFLQTEKSQKHYFSKIDEYRKISDSVSILELKIHHKRELIINIADNLSKTYNVKNVIKYNDSVLYFNRILTGSKKEKIVSDSIQKLWVNYKNDKFNLTLLDKKLSSANKYLNEQKDLKESYIKNYSYSGIMGGLSFFLGILLWMIDGESDSSVRKKQHEKIYGFCQSCGQNFSSMKTYGFNKDKSLNYAFCIECYKKGKFREPDLTKEQAKKRLYDLKKQKSWLVKKLYKIRFSRLERWK